MNLESGVLQVHIEDIIPNRFQPRLNFDEQGLKELSDSIREHGIIQPLVLRKLGDKYEIIAGERRYKAAQIAGLTTVRAVIANKLRLLNLDEEVQQALLEERISERHARTLLSLQDKDAQREWLHRVINERLTVRQLDLELKKLKSPNDLVIEGEESEGTGDVQLVSSIPSLEDIKANAMDITEANKIQNNPMPQPEMLETLDEINPIEPTSIDKPEMNSFFNNPIQNNDNSFTTATTIPEFNIATPNSSSTFVSSENLVETNNDNRFFTMGSIDNNQIENPQTANLFNATPNMSTTTGNLEIFDAPTENNSFVAEQSTPVEEIVQKEEKPQFSTMDLSPNNRFFTPSPEKMPEITFEKAETQDVDPMASVDKLTSNMPNAKTSENMGLKDAIATLRTCIEGLGDKGFYIDVEEIDFDSNYQITMRIHKDN